MRLADLALDCLNDVDGPGGERALPFYLTRQLPFTDLTVKAAHDPSKLWSMTGRPITDADGAVTGFRGIGCDLSERGWRRRSAARYDSLTGLPNRAMILRALEDTLRRRSARYVLILVDLDRFKEINDT